MQICLPSCCNTVMVEDLIILVEELIFQGAAMVELLIIQHTVMVKQMITLVTVMVGLLIMHLGFPVKELIFF